MALGDKSYGLTTGPGFYAVPSVNQSIATTTALVNYGTVTWTSGHFSSSRFTVPVSGIYEIKFYVSLQGIGGTNITWRVYKNGVSFYSLLTTGSTTEFNKILEYSSVVGDYWEIYITSTSSITVGATLLNYFGMKKVA